MTAALAAPMEVSVISCGSGSSASRHRRISVHRSFTHRPRRALTSPRDRLAQSGASDRVLRSAARPGRASPLESVRLPTQRRRHPEARGLCSARGRLDRWSIRSRRTVRGRRALRVPGSPGRRSRLRCGQHLAPEGSRYRPAICSDQMDAEVASVMPTHDVFATQLADAKAGRQSRATARLGYGRIHRERDSGHRTHASRNLSVTESTDALPRKRTMMHTWV